MNPSPSTGSGKYFVCGYCGQVVKCSKGEERGKFYPFCSEKCKLADLGNWLQERYRIPGPPARVPTDEDQKSKKQ